MFTFIVPLKSPKVSKNWQQVLKLYERTIRSICNQTNPNFRVVVISNVIPDINFQHPNIEYILVDFYPKTSEIKTKYLDKGRRLLTGMIHVKNSQSTHVMIVDSDDCVSKHIVEFVAQNSRDSRNSGWFVNSGYVYQEGSRLIYLRKKWFNKWCGTANIFNLNRIHLLEDSAIEDEANYSFYDDHKYPYRKIIKDHKKFPYLPLPFHGVVYNIGNQENIYQTGFDKVHQANQSFIFRLKDIINFRWLTPKIREEFGLYPLNQ